jgi:hypothetical protein
VLAIDGKADRPMGGTGGAAARAAAGRQLRFEIERDGGRLELVATPRLSRRAGKNWDDWA